MPSIYDIKPRFQALLRPLVRGLAGAGATANQVTLAALGLSLAVGALVAAVATPRVLLLLPLWLFLRMALNAIDGMLAREHGQASKLGAVLNELGDVLADAGLYLPLALRAEFPPLPLVLLVLLGVIAEMTGVVGVQIGASRRYDGPLGKSDRAFLFGLLGLLLGLGLAAGAWLHWLLWLAVILAALTIINRARQALREIAQ
ncbi:MAG: CDP-alcohol phosphatidyltransferase family protein [Lysobacterales bacterium]